MFELSCDGADGAVWIGRNARASEPAPVMDDVGAVESTGVPERL